LSIDVAGRDFGSAEPGRFEVDWLKDIDVCGRPPGPTLLEKLLLDVCREDTDGVRDDDIDEVKDAFRLCPTDCIDF
jgi:hypothetical protein